MTSEPLEVVSEWLLGKMTSGPGKTRFETFSITDGETLILLLHLSEPQFPAYKTRVVMLCRLLWASEAKYVNFPMPGTLAPNKWSYIGDASSVPLVLSSFIPFQSIFALIISCNLLHKGDRLEVISRSQKSNRSARQLMGWIQETIMHSLHKTCL